MGHDPVMAIVLRSMCRAARTAVMFAALLALLAATGCTAAVDDGGAEPTGGRTPSVDEVRLVVSRDFGGEVLRDVVVPAGDGTDALRVLAANAEVETSYGGQFVDAIEGLSSSFGSGTEGPADWFYWVDGVMGDVGAADTKLKGGETVWWDYHRWASAMVVPLALHAFPRPYAGRPLEVTAAADVAGLGDWAAANGLELKKRRPLPDRPQDGGLVLATAAEAARTPWVLELLDAAHSGIQVVRVTDGELCTVSPDGETGPLASAVAQPAINVDDPGRPFLVVLGATAADLESFLPALTADSVSAAVAVALVDGQIVNLPWQAE